MARPRPAARPGLERQRATQRSLGRALPPRLRTRHGFPGRESQGPGDEATARCGAHRRALAAHGRLAPGDDLCRQWLEGGGRGPAEGGGTANDGRGAEARSPVESCIPNGRRLLGAQCVTRHRIDAARAHHRRRPCPTGGFFLFADRLGYVRGLRCRRRLQPRRPVSRDRKRGHERPSRRDHERQGAFPGHARGRR